MKSRVLLGVIARTLSKAKGTKQSLLKKYEIASLSLAMTRELGQGTALLKMTIIKVCEK